MKPVDREAFFARLAAANPNPTSELAYTSPYELLVAVILSAQATDLSVNKAMAKLFPVANTPEAIVALGTEGIEPYIRTIGLYRTKARNVIAMSRMLIEVHGGIVPQDRTALEALPGVGRKTANVILNVVFGEHTLAVDTHVFRVANRTGLAKGKTVDVVETKLMKVVPKQFLFGAHHWLILHGRHVCKARRPECWHCAVSDLCPFRPKTPAP
jgi:endonuclease-3